MALVNSEPNSGRAHGNRTAHSGCCESTYTTPKMIELEYCQHAYEVAPELLECLGLTKGCGFIKSVKKPSGIKHVWEGNENSVRRFAL